MVNKELIDYVKSQKAQGYSSQQLYDILLRQGYTGNEIQEVLNAVDRQASGPFNKNFILLTVSFIVIAVLATAFLYSTSTTFSEPICNSDIECNDNNIDTIDTCVNPSTITSRCINAEKTTLSDTGQEITVQEPFSFNLNGTYHSLEVNEINDTSVTISIYSEPKKITLKVGEFKEIDVDSDGTNDLYIKLISIINNKPMFQIKTLPKTIINEISSYECGNRNCTQTCAGCERGTQICESVSETCMDCIIDSNCKTGYKCRNNNCISWECDSAIDCSDSNVSTKDTCSNYKCSHVAITQCINSDLYCPANCNSTNDNDCAPKCGTQIIDCGTTVLTSLTDLPTDNSTLCYMNAAQNCCLAKKINEGDVDMFGIVDIHYKSYNEIKGLEGERCAEYVRTDEYNIINYTEDVWQQLLDDGKTTEEIELQLASVRQQYNEMVGTYSICRYSINELVNRINGTYTFDSDLTKYNCTGTLYDTT